MALVAAREYPESRMRVGEIVRGEGGLTIPMAVGPWMHAPGGPQLAASLGVLVDDAIGIVIYLNRPEGTHSVTTELSLDIVAPPPWAGPDLVATSAVTGMTDTDGVSRAEVRDGTGQLIAVASGRCRFVTVTGVHEGVGTFADDPPRRLAAPDQDSVLAALGVDDPVGALARDPDLSATPELARLHTAPMIPSPRPGAAAGAPERVSLAVPPDEAFGNASGTMHGGIQLAGLDVAAAALAGALGPDGAASYTTSARVNLLRPALLTAPVVFTASVVSRGRSLSVFRVTSSGPAGKPYSIATVTRAALG